MGGAEGGGGVVSPATCTCPARRGARPFALQSFARLRRGRRDGDSAEGGKWRLGAVAVCHLGVLR